MIASSALATPRGSMPVLAYFAPAQFSVDPLYQRALDAKSRALIARIAAEWDWQLCLPLVVARRPDGSLYVVDGQHRLEGARKRGDIAILPCVVIEPADPTEEADLFVRLNQQRRPLTPVALYNAALAANDAGTVALDAIVRDVGLRFAKTSDLRAIGPGELTNVGTVRSRHARHGNGPIRAVLSAMARAFDGQVIITATPIFNGTLTVALERGDAFDADMMTDILARPQEEWLADFRQAAAQDGLGLSAAASSVLRAAYAEAADDDDAA